MRELETDCHGNQFGSSWGHPAGPWMVGMVIHVAWDGWDSRVLQSRAEPHCIPYMG